MNKSTIEAKGGNIMQVFTLSKGNTSFPVSVTPIPIGGDCILYAVEDATFTVTWSDASTEALSFLQGNTIGFSDVTSITVTIGSIHLMK